MVPLGDALSHLRRQHGEETMRSAAPPSLEDAPPLSTSVRCLVSADSGFNPVF